MPIADKDRAGYSSCHRTQESQCAFPKLEGCGVYGQAEIVEAERLAQPDVTELPVNGVRVGKRQTFSGNGDGEMLLSDGKRELQLQRLPQIHRLYKRFKTL